MLALTDTTLTVLPAGFVLNCQAYTFLETCVHYFGKTGERICL